MSAYGIVEKVEYLGVAYHILEPLDNFLLLVVPQEDIDNKRFPISPLVIPNVIHKQ